MDEFTNNRRKVVIITGANSGLGYETAKRLAAQEFKIILACRDAEKANEAQVKIQQNIPSAQTHFLPLDLGSFNSIRSFCKEFRKHYAQLDLLINNAGIMLTPYRLTEDGLEQQMGVNYLGHFLLTSLLLSTLESTAGSRIITVSSLAHRYGKIDFTNLDSKKKFHRMKAYANSKLACLVYAYELDRRLQQHDFQVASIAAHPGVAMTNLPAHLSPILIPVGNLLTPWMLQDARRGAQSIIAAAVDPNIKGGDYIGPDSFRGWRGKPTKVDSSRMSKNDEMGKKLWETSVSITKASYPF